MSVAKRVEPYRRTVKLSWSHHAEVAALPGDEQTKFLELAVEKNFKVLELRQAIRLSKVIQPPQPKLDWHEPQDRPEIPLTLEEHYEQAPDPPEEEYPEVGEQVTERPSQLEFDFKHLVDLCRALRDAVRGNLASGVEPDEKTANRLWSALEHFLAPFDRQESREP
jgi:hypothetical protein